jgi:membrane protease subunit HflK
MERILPKIGTKVVMDEKGNNILPLLNLGNTITPSK